MRSLLLAWIGGALIVAGIALVAGGSWAEATGSYLVGEAEVALTSGSGLPSVALRTFRSAAELAEVVGAAWIPQARGPGQPMIGLERYPDGSDQASSLSLPGFGLSWISGVEGAAVAIWASARDTHALLTFSTLQPPPSPPDPCGAVAA